MVENPKHCYGRKKPHLLPEWPWRGASGEPWPDNWHRKNSLLERGRRRDLHKEILVGLLDGNNRGAHAHRADDIWRQLKLLSSIYPWFGSLWRPLYCRRDSIIWASCCLWTCSWEGSNRSWKACPRHSLVLNSWASRWPYSHGPSEISIKYLPLCASILHKWGLSWKDAFSCITINWRTSWVLAIELEVQLLKGCRYSGLDGDLWTSTAGLDGYN